MTNDDTPTARDEKPRNGNGKWTQTVTGAERRAEALAHARNHMTYDRIAEVMGISKSYAYQLVKDGLAEIPRENAIAVRDMVAARTQASQERLMELRAQILEAMGGEHITVSQGRVVEFNGEPVADHDYIIRASGPLIRIEEQLGKNEDRMINLLGLRVPPKVETDVHVTYTIEGLDDD